MTTLNVKTQDDESNITVLYTGFTGLHAVGVATTLFMYGQDTAPSIFMAHHSNPMWGSHDPGTTPNTGTTLLLRFLLRPRHLVCFLLQEELSLDYFQEFIDQAVVFQGSVQVISLGVVV